MKPVLQRRRPLSVLVFILIAGGAPAAAQTERYADSSALRR